MRSLIKIRETSPLPDPGKISALDVANARREAADIFRAYDQAVPGYLIRSEVNRKLSLEVPGISGIAGLTLTPASHGPVYLPILQALQGSMRSHAWPGSIRECNQGSICPSRSPHECTGSCLDPLSS